MANNVTKFYAANAAEKPDAVLEQCVGQFDQVIVIGIASEGENTQSYELRASLGLSDADAALWMQRALQNLYSE